MSLASTVHDDRDRNENCIYVYAHIHHRHVCTHIHIQDSVLVAIVFSVFYIVSNNENILLK